MISQDDPMVAPSREEKQKQTSFLRFAYKYIGIEEDDGDLGRSATEASQGGGKPTARG